MSAHAECPKCRNEFLVKSNLKYGLRLNLSFMKLALRNIAFPWIDGLEEIHKSNLVVCPECGKEFISEGYRYFGFIEPKHLQIGLAAVVLLFVFSFLAVLIWSALKTR